MRPGELVLEVEGVDLLGLDNEPGGHRIQRIPPTERKGRVHTSTVTVSVLEKQIKNLVISDNDLRIEWYSGTGAGGQFRNKHDNSIRITHIPTGITQTAQTRSRSNSYNVAFSKLNTAVNGSISKIENTRISSLRKIQVGSGQRGDKIRTIRFQDNSVTDHITGKKMQADRYMKGYMNELWL